MPSAEWHRLEGLEIGKAPLGPLTSQVWVVEDGDKIIATWATFVRVEAHGFWIHPDYRGTFGAAKWLMRGMRQMATFWGVSQVITGSVSAHVSELLRKWRGKRIEEEFWVLPVETIKSERQRDREAGEKFHAQLGEHESHAEDPIHNEHVGHALRTAIAGEPERAAREYNSIAAEKGYARVDYLGGDAHSLRGAWSTSTDHVVFEVDQNLKVKILEAVCR